MRSFLICLVLASVLAHGQTVPRKRVGVALAGGGAKGLAHIGVLRWMEENRIPIDAVSGTSMGGLVGGMYAAGSDSAEMTKFVQELDWDLLLGDSAGYRDLAYRRKEDHVSFPARLEFGLHDGRPQLPSAINAGHQIDLLFERIAGAYPEMRSFDDLPTPFRCVATDLLSGDKVVFADNSLPRALRATMAIPAMFSPVSYNNMLLADGGMVDNIPAGVLRDMRVDVVIAVDLGMETFDKEKSLSFVGVIGRSLDVMMRRNALESLRSADLVVKPSVLDFGTLEFREVTEIIDRGYRAAEAMSAQLKPLAVSESEWQAYLAARKSKVPAAGFTPEFIEVTGGTPEDNTSVAERLQSFQNKPLDREKLEESLTRVTGQGIFETAGYRRVKRDGKDGLGIDIKPNSYGPPTVRPLFMLDSNQSGNTSFTIAARITAYNFPARHSELRTDLSFGRFNLLGSEYYQFLGWSGLFAAPRGFISQEQQIFARDGQRIAEYKVRRGGGGFDFGYNFGRFSEFRTGIEAAHMEGTVQIGSPILPNVEGTEQIWMTRWRVNAVNNGAIPTRGWLVDTQVNWQYDSPDTFAGGQNLGSTDPFGQAWSRILYAKPLTDKWTAVFRVLGGGTFAGPAAPFSDFRLGGPFRLGALETGELRGDYVAYASIAGLRKIHEAPASFIGNIYAMAMYETGDAFRSRMNLFHTGTAGVMAETNLGVLGAGYSYGEQGRHGFFFSLGRVFDVGGRGSNVLR